MTLHKSATEPDHLDRLFDRVQELVEAGSATYRELADFLGKPAPRVSEWITMRKFIPNGRVTLQIQEWVYRKTGEMKKARQQLLLAAELEPDNARAHYQLGRLYTDTNDLVHAKAEFERTAELQGRAAGTPPAP